MDTGYIWLVLGTFFTTYSIYAWKKNTDYQWLQLGLLGTGVIFLLVFRLFLITLFPQSVQVILKVVVWTSCIPLLYFLIIIVLKMRECRKLYEESETDVDTIITQLVSSWNSDRLIEDASSELRGFSSKEEIREGFSAFANQFGSLKQYRGSKGNAIISLNPFRPVRVKHVAEALFEKGSVKIYVERLKEDGNWKIRSFYLRANG